MMFKYFYVIVWLRIIIIEAFSNPYCDLSCESGWSYITHTACRLAVNKLELFKYNSKNINYCSPAI